MARTPDNLVRHELIGLHMAVVDATDANRVGVDGRVIDETRNTLRLETETGETTVPKAGTTLRFDLDTAQVNVDGRLLIGRPEERILKKFPQKWEYTD